MSEPRGRERLGRQQSRSIWLVYGVVGLVAAVLFTQYLRVPGMQTSAPDSPPRSQVTPTVQWQRIGLRTNEDLERALPVLLDFIEHPEHALSLTELTIDTARTKYCGDHDEDDPLGIELQALSAQEQKLTEAVKTIDLGSELENKIIEALLWKARGLDAPEARGISNQACMSRCLQANRRLQYANAAAILFCSLSPNLSSLRTTEPAGTLSQFLLTVNYRWASQSTDSPLANLARVQLIDRSRYDILNDERFYRNSDALHFVQHFHHLPLLAAVGAYTISDQRAELDVIPPGLSSLKSISITHSDLSSQTMCGLIRLAISLEDIHFSTGGRDTNDGGHAVVYPKSLGKCLEQHKTTLRSIDLDLDAYVWARAHVPADVEGEDFAEENRYSQDEEYFQDTLEFYRSDAGWKADEEKSKACGYALLSRDLPDTKKYGNTIGSFADFEKLQSLKIGIKLLLGAYDGWGDEKKPPENLVEMLPPSLTHLTIRGYSKGRWEEHDKHVEQLREEMALKLPLLVSVQGLDDEVPSGEAVSDVDAKDAPLYVEPPVENGWLESQALG